MVESEIDSYISQFPDETKKILINIRSLIKKLAPQATESINYGIPTFNLRGNLVHFAGFKKHIGFYPSPSAISKFEKELSLYKHSRGSVQFPLDKPIPYDLIEKMVLFRINEQKEK